MINSETQKIDEGINLDQLPNPDGYKGNAETQVRKKRDKFYKKLAILFPDGKVYYPGSGSDPIPFKWFGKKVIYGSLMESNYFSMLKDKRTPKPSAYKAAILQTKNIKQIDGVYADIKKSPFPEKSFKIIILNSIPVEFNQQLAEELKRILDDDGIIVVEENGNIEVLNQQIESLKTRGFSLQQIDGAGVITNVMYFGLPKDGGEHYHSDGKPVMSNISLAEFKERFSKGEPVQIWGHLFKVLKKQLTD